VACPPNPGRAAMVNQKLRIACTASR
jgi:hypothetical protein